jgi:RNA polymerase sigma-70 factor (ECF subfamily)
VTSTEERDDGIARLLVLLAERGEGTELGPARGRAGIGRVSRQQAEQFARRLAATYQERYPLLLRFAVRRVGDHARAEDAVQAAFEKVLRRHAGDAPEILNLDAYVFTAVSNEINRELRGVIGQRDRQSDADVAETAGPGDLSASVAEALLLRRELARLSPREREAVVIRLQWQLSVEETAEVMGVSPGSVKRYTFDGLRRLRERLATAV